ncbi:MAG: T9SS type A sorting domain-containing protein [Nitrospirae bacterium]|nr:T9SS type A sorting domain-containing protein [Nitrospirota bacterium]
MGDEIECVWSKQGVYSITAKVTITTEEGLVMQGQESSHVTIEAGKPTAMPGGPYRGGIFGGNFSPIQFEGNHPDFVEDNDIGHIDTWQWSFQRGGSANVWNPTRAFEYAGEYKATLKVRSEYGKWSDTKEAHVEVIDGKIAGYVRAADLRTPVEGVTLSLTSSHVNKDVLRRIANESKDPFKLIAVDTEIGIILQTSTDNKGYYEFAHLPLGEYLIRVSKGTGDKAHEFQKQVINTEITLNGPNQLAIDFVDITVAPVGGRVIYSLQKNGQDVLVEDVTVTAQCPGAGGYIYAEPSKKSLSATGVNYSMPLLAGQYLFIAKGEHYIRIKPNTPDYDSDTQLVTIEGARTNVDFVNYTTRKLTVFVNDSGGYNIASQTVTISGDNGQAEGISGENGFSATLNPGKYTVFVKGALPEEKEVDLSDADSSVEMIIPVKIELSVGPMPRLVDGAFLEFLVKDCGIPIEDIDTIEGYMIYLPAPNTIGHTFTVTPTAREHPVGSFTLHVRDEVGMLTQDPPDDQKIEADGKEYEYQMLAGVPKMTTDDPPLAAPKKITFWITKDGYLDSDKVEIEVTVLGDVDKGLVGDIISLPQKNYLVLHDPPGDGSYSYIDETLTLSRYIWGVELQIGEIKSQVYPDLWHTNRWLADDPNIVLWPFLANTAIEYGLGAIAAIIYKNIDDVVDTFEKAGGSLGFWGGGPVVNAAGKTVQCIGKLTQLGIGIVSLAAWTGKATALATGLSGFQYDVSPNRHLETPSGDELPDLLGPGKGDVYYGEGLTIGLQSKYRLGIKPIEGSPRKWKLYTEEIITYKPLERKNQYIYTAADIGKMVIDLGTKTEIIKKQMEEIAKKKGTESAEYKEKNTTKEDLEKTKNKWVTLLNENLAYKWQKDYVSEGKSFEEFLKGDGSALQNAAGETLIFNAGPTFEYSRTIHREDMVSYSTEVGQETAVLKLEGGEKLWFKFETSLKSGVGLSREFQSGESVEQSIGFVLNDDDVSDYYSCRVFEDPTHGTPIFFQEAGCSSDPWEQGTNKNVDVTLELVKDIKAGKFDYHEGAHYKIKLKYCGQRELKSSGINFVLYDSVADNEENLTVRFNGNEGPYVVELSKESPVADVVVSVYPPEMDQDNSEEKEYPLTIGVIEENDDQISRAMNLSLTFADMRAPRATIVAPYSGERISPVFFAKEPDPSDQSKKGPFKVEVISSDMDIDKIKLQIRSKQPDGVWEPWRDLSGMVWEGTNTDMVTLFEYLDRVPPRREFTFKWIEDEIKRLGVGEYAIRAVAMDRADKANTDLDPPNVVFLVDESKPSVLTSVPDYQDKDSERIYRGELSVLFTDDMREMEFTDRTFMVIDLLNNNKQVAGYVSYSPALRKATFVPVVPFNPYGFYRVEIKTDEKKDGKIEKGVHDLAGNPLDNAFMWTFHTLGAPFEPTWSIILSAEDGMNKDGNNIAAVEYGALDTEDAKDARAVPSLANQLRLNFLNSKGIEFDRDIRPADGRLSHHWFFAVSNAKYGATVTIKFQPSLKLTKTSRDYQVMQLVEFDNQGRVTNVIKLDPTQAEINDLIGEIKPMVAYTYLNKGEDCRYFRLDLQRIGLVAEEFHKGPSGWRFFSVPITPQRSDPFVNLGDDIDPFKLYQYDTRLSGYKIYPLDIGQVALQPGHGYFTMLEKNVEVDVGGARNYVPATVTMQHAGWHAIGNPFLLPVNVASLQVQEGTFSSVVSFAQAVANGLIEGTLYRWNVGTLTDSYVVVTMQDKLNRWEGYWLRTKKQDISLIIPVPDGETKEMPELPPSFRPYVFYTSPLMEQESPHQFVLGLELFSSGVSDISTILGTHQNARQDSDTLDSMEPPIMPQTIAAYFEHPDLTERVKLYNRDYQPCLEPGQECVWQLVVHSDQPNTQMKLSWDKTIGQIPADIVLSFRKAGGQIIGARLAPDAEGWQDMRQVSSVELTSSPMLVTKFRFEIKARRLDVTPPDGIKAVAKEQRVMLCWRRVDNPNIEGYTITRWDRNGKITQYQVDKKTDQFIDTNVNAEAIYTYQVAVLTIAGTQLQGEEFMVTVGALPDETVLLPCYPNPSNTGVRFPYKLAENTEVKIEIYNIAGELVRRLEEGMQSQGDHIADNAAYWDGRTQSGERAASGIYIYLFKAGGYTVTGKIGMVR